MKDLRPPITRQQQLDGVATVGPRTIGRRPQEWPAPAEVPVGEAWSTLRSLNALAGEEKLCDSSQPFEARGRAGPSSGPPASFDELRTSFPERHPLPRPSCLSCRTSDGRSARTRPGKTDRRSPVVRQRAHARSLHDFPTTCAACMHEDTHLGVSERYNVFDRMPACSPRRSTIAIPGHGMAPPLSMRAMEGTRRLGSLGCLCCRAGAARRFTRRHSAMRMVAPAAIK